MSYMNFIGVVLMDHRLDRGLKQCEVARLSGVGIKNDFRIRAWVSARRDETTCSGMPGCAACYAELHAKIAAAETRERTWSLALQSLTPGGSEYADDPERCLAFVRGAREWQHGKILTLVKDLKHLREQAGPDSCADQVVRRIEAEKRAEEAERLYASVANPKCLDDACGHLWREHEASGEDCEEPCLVADCSCDAFEGESSAARITSLASQLAESEHKGLQLVNYLGPLMLAATGVVNGRMGGMDELRRMLDVKYDPTKGEALSLTAQLAHERERVAEYTRAMEEKDRIIADTAAQLSAANANIELLRTQIGAAIEARIAESQSRPTCLCVRGSFDCSYHEMLFALETAEAKERS